MRTIVAAVLVVLISPAAPAKTRATRSTHVTPVAAQQWTLPQCQSTGLPWLRYVERDGTTHGSSVDRKYAESRHIHGLAVGAPANTLWALDETGMIHRSGDAGCTWSEVTSVPEVLAEEAFAEFAARHADRVYVYTSAKPIARPTSIVRLTGATVETFAAPDPVGFIGIEVSPTDSLHLRAIGRSGTAWESKDGAATWKPVGAPKLFINFVRAAAFNPRDFDHILIGTRSQGLWESRDGGRTWTLLAFAATEVEGVRFAPSNPDVVYAGVVPSSLRRSTDGGRTFKNIDVAVAGPYARLYYMDRLFAVNPRDPLAFASEGDRAVGVKITSPAGKVTSKAFENVGELIWAPNGLIYYTMTWAELR
ncbi:MAG TPA: hypothetical protein VF883_20725 [Thermoanaerobaculia bacterium]